MLTFAQTITKLLTQYKTITKRDMSTSEWNTKMSKLGLRRKQLREDTEVTLYHKAHLVLQDVAERVNNSNMSYWYSGIDEFYQHFKSVLDEYYIEENKVLHAAQQASRAVVLALQLMEVAGAERSTYIAQELDKCGHIIAKCGTLEQQAMFSKMLRNFQHHDINFFQSLHEQFEEYLEKFTNFMGQEELA